MSDTDFGYQAVSFAEKTKKVDDLFNTVSPYYDLMNDILSFGLHRFWKKKFVQKISPQANDCLIDLACGSGDITLELIKSCPDLSLSLVDPSPSMLRQARLKIAQKARGLLQKKGALSFYQLWAEDLSSLERNSFDKVVCAFGFRNMTKKEQALEQIYLALKPGGTIHLLEFSQVKGLLKPPYEFYRDSALPAIGELMGDKASYEYLAHSIERFWSPKTVCKHLTQVGFHNLKSEPMSQGICYYFSGKK